MYISFLFFCHLCLLYFTVRVEQSAIHARGCCFCHPSTFQNPGPQSAKWTHPKKFLLNKSPMEVHPGISAEPMNSVNFRVKFQLSWAFLPFPLPFGLSGSTQAFAGPIWAASLSLVKKTNPHAHRIVLIFSFSHHISSKDFLASLDIIDQGTTASLPLLPKSAFTGTKTPPDSPPTWHSMAQLLRSSSLPPKQHCAA